MRSSWRLTLLPLLVCILLLPLSAGCQLAGPASSSEGVLNLWDTGPMTLDPAVSAEMTSHAYVMHIFSGLVRLDDELEVAPDIAERWQRSSDGKSYTFYLRRGVRFHDGSEVNARDFKYSWERACTPDTGSQTAATYLGDIVGVREMLAGAAEEISGLKVIDDHTLEVKIDAPKAYFLLKLTYPTAFVVDRADVEAGEDWWQQPNGTGPFRLEKWQRGQSLVLQRNEHYYGEAARVEQVVFHLLAGMPIAMYEKGEIDVTPISRSYIDWASDETNPLHRELVLAPELSLYYVGFDTAAAPFDDVNVRRGFCCAVDRKRIVSLIFRDMMTAAEGILPPGMPGYNEDLRGLDYDTARAREFIAASSYGDVAELPPIAVTISGYGNNIPGYLGAIIEEWRRNLGVEVSVRQLDPEDFLYNMRREKDEMFVSGWVADYPDPHNFLDNLFYTGSEHNISDYSNPELDSLLEKAAIEQDEAARLAMYQQAEQEIVNEAPCLPLCFTTSYMLVKPYVHDYEVSPLGIPDLSKVYVTEH